MLDGIEITTARHTMRDIRRAIRAGIKLWDGAEFLLADVPLNRLQAMKVLPLGMRLTERPVATVFICDYPKTAFTVAYREAAVLIHVKTPLGRGLHCCWMVVDDDTAMILGREMLGYPKKMADIAYEDDGKTVRASVKRRGVEVLAMRGARIDPHTQPAPIFDIKTFNVGGPGQFGALQPVWLFRPREIVHESNGAEVDFSAKESWCDPIAPLFDGPPLLGRIARSDIMGSHYNFPVGLAGPAWFCNTYNMRTR